MELSADPTQPGEGCSTSRASPSRSNVILGKIHHHRKLQPQQHLTKSKPNLATEVHDSKLHRCRINCNDVLMHPILITLSTEMMLIHTSITTPSTLLQDHTNIHPFLSDIYHKAQCSANTYRLNSQVSA